MLPMRLEPSHLALLSMSDPVLLLHLLVVLVILIMVAVGHVEVMG